MNHDIKIVVEKLWEFEAIYGLSKAVTEAMLRLQEAAGYSTPFDRARKQTTFTIYKDDN